MKLIFFPENNIKPNGGPAGYLHNLKDGIRKRDEDIVFLPSSSESKKKQRIKNIVPDFILDLRYLIKLLTIHNKSKRVDLKYADCELIHFHSTEDMFYAREFLKNYTGKVILTSHSPCAYHIELINRLNPLYKRFFSKALRKVEIIDQYAFGRADKIIFPCREAEEPYFHTWKNYANYRDESKYLYLATGIEKVYPKEDSLSIRKRFGIPENAFVVSFVGRHNIIKGYADLKKAAKRILETNKDVYFLIAGNERPLKGLDSNRWIEAGWTNDPHSLISAADVFVLPNRETYFDLVLLEVLSLGKPVILSETGGNKYFKKFDSNGIIYFTDIESLVKSITAFQKLSSQKKSNLGMQNEEIFNREFTNDIFAEKYVDLLSGLL